MRLLLTAALVFPLLAACAGKEPSFAVQQVPQTGTLKVHPGLVGAAKAEEKPANTPNPDFSQNRANLA